MKKENIYKFLYAVCILLVIGFIVRIVADLVTYNPMETSFPFYANVILRAVEFILPCIACFIAGIIFKKKYHR